MPTYTLELELLGTYLTDMPGFEIWADGAQLGTTYSISSSGSSISTSFTYGGALPSSIEFRFTDASPETPRTIEVQSVKINDRYVNTGNYLSSDNLTNGQTSTVDIAGGADIFDQNYEPLASEFTTGATATFTASYDFYRKISGTADAIFDMLDGDDYAHTAGGDDKIAGGAGDDFVRAGDGNDLLFGGADNDRLFGQGDDDEIYGGSGNDRLFGNDGDDEVHGGTGDDKVNGNAGNDLLTGGDGDDLLNAGTGNDIVFGDDGVDTLIGGAGDDTLDGGDGDDVIYGGIGADQINGGDDDDILIGNGDNDIISGDAGDDQINGGLGDDTLRGGDGSDFITGEDGNDNIDGGIGLDILVGGAGVDTINGGDGNDIIHGHGLNVTQVRAVLNANPNVVYNAQTNSFYEFVTTSDTWAGARATANASVINGIAGHLANITSLAEQEYVFGLVTTAGDAWLGGSDAITEGDWRWVDGAEAGTQFWSGDASGGAINNMYENFAGGQPNDATGAGSDNLHFLKDGNAFDGFWGDREDIRTGEYIIEWDAGLMLDDNANDILNGGSGQDTIYGYGGDDVIFAGDGNDTIFGGDGDDNIRGEGNFDYINGGNGNDLLDGDGGDDTILGGDGDDTILGNIGNDILTGGAGLDNIDAGLDDDLINLANGDFVAGEVLNGNLGTDQLILTNATTVDLSIGTVTLIEDLVGSSGNDDVTYTITQALSFDSIDLGDGIDNSRVQTNGTVNVTALGTPIVTNAENGFLVGTGAVDNVTITGAQLDALVFGAGTIDMGAGADTINLTSTSAVLNTLVDGSLIALERVNASTAGAGVTINLGAQTEGFLITGSGNADILTTGAGDDTINAGNGNDVIETGTGVDTINAGNGNDTINLANGDFEAGESIDGGVGTDELILTNATIVDFSTGTLANLETLTGSTGNDDVTYTITQALAFDDIDLGGGTDNSRVQVNGTVDVTALGTPTVTNAENGFLTGSTGDDDLTITGAQLNSLIYGAGIIDFDSGTDVIRLTTISSNLATLAASDGGIVGLEEIDYSTVGSSPVTLDLTAQTEDFIVTTGGGQDIITGGSGDDTIDGNTGNDDLFGGLGNDTIIGGQGFDEIYGGAGADIIDAGTENDSIYGGGADFLGDTIDGGAGTGDAFVLTANATFDSTVSFTNMERIHFNNGGAWEINVTSGDSVDFTGFVVSGSSVIRGASGSETITATEASDIIQGGNGADTLSGNGGNDRFIGGGTEFLGDIFDGGAGTDTIDFFAASFFNLASTFTDVETLDMNGFNAIAEINTGFDFTGMTVTARGNMLGQGGNETITGSDSNDIIDGQAGDDTLDGGLGADAIFGGTGNDTILGGDGTDVMDGGADIDVVTYASSLVGVTVDLSNTGSQDTVGAGFDTISNIENLVGTSFDDILTGDANDNTISGGAANDIVNGGGGNDFLNGNSGNDTIRGGLGIDVMLGLSGDDILDGSDGDEADTIDGGADNDTVTYSSAAGGVFVDLADATAQDTQGAGVDTISNVENVTGSGFNDALDGDAGDNILTGLAGDDEIEGHGGNDTMDGGAGIDVVTYESAGSAVTVDLSVVTAQSTLGAGTDTLSNFENLTGSDFNDTLTGDTGDNIIAGLDGNDTIDGGDGNDTILGGNGNDTLTGGDGDDTIYGATIIGQSGVESVIQTSSAQWHSVTFAATIVNPVIKMSNMTNNDGDFYTVRVRSVTDSGFEYQIDEWDYLDGSRVLAEELSWLAIAEGTHTLDNGSVVQAGLTTATNEDFTTVTFDSAFGSAPVVMSQVMSDNEASAVASRNRNRTTTGFEFQMQEEEANANVHATETIGWIAIDNGGSAASGFLIGETGDVVTHNVTTVNFGGSGFANTPVVLHDQETRDGGDTSYSQADGITTTTGRFFIGEEQSANAEVDHTTEVVGYYALNEGLLSAAGGGDNTITGGDGLDTLYGGDGADTFVFEALSAYLDEDILGDFSVGENDILDISDLITSGTVNAGNIGDYLNLDDTSGTHTIIQVDGDGTGGGLGFQNIGRIEGITGLDEATLFTNGNILA